MADEYRPKRKRLSKQPKKEEIPIELDKIKFLFENEDILELELLEERVRIDEKVEPNYLLTPYTKKIYDSLDTVEKERFIRDIMIDDLKISDLENKINDKNYNPEPLIYDYLEYIISYFSKCPVCGMNTLRKYANISMPVIDIVCINDHPPNKTRYFQIKTTNGTLFKGLPYFSKRDKFIKVGSRIFGENIHKITNDRIYNDYQNMLIGYICIEYTTLDDIIKVNHRNSFYIIPDISDNIQYEYVQTNIIEFKTNPRNLSDIFNIVDIPKNLFFNTRIIRNKLGLQVRQPIFDKYKYLYLKYKSKYLKLKNNI